MVLTIGREFEFQTGNWTVKHQRLVTRLAGANDWQEFGGRCQAYPTLGGAGNVEDNFIDFPGGAYRAVALRSFDSISRLWAIWWLDARNAHHLDVPVKGAFENGTGRFYADDEFAGQPIRVCFEWTDIETDKPRWQQAFSTDNGQSWEVNWVMNFARA